MQKGFTLIELLVVVLIIAILSAVALPQYEAAVAKSRYTQLITGADMLKKANQIYYLANGQYTMNLNDLDLSLSGCKAADNGRSCVLNNKGKNSVVCYLNDGSTDASGTLRPIVYCYSNDLYYSLRNDSNDHWCYATATNDTANQVCKSMGGVYKSESNGHKNYLLP